MYQITILSLQFNTVDESGGSSGYCSADYLDIVSVVDAQIGALLDAINDESGDEWMVSLCIHLY